MRLYRVIGIAALCMLLAACGAPSGSEDGNPEELEGSVMEEELQSAEAEEQPEEWPKVHHSCGVQELSGYLYDHTSVSVSPYAGAEITIKDYEGEQLETDWDEPSAFQFAGEADVTWWFFNSLAEMEAALNEAAMQKMDDNSLHFLYYTFPLTEDEQEEKSKRERRDSFAPIQKLPEGAEPEDYIKLTGDRMLDFLYPQRPVFQGRPALRREFPD